MTYVIATTFHPSSFILHPGGFVDQTVNRYVAIAGPQYLEIDMSSPFTFDTLVLGTNNQKKCSELRLLLEPLGLKLCSLAEIEKAIEVDETGSTFMENARLKATEQARHLGRWTIGEDSGLCLPGLGGEPGIYSARYSDPGATDQRNNEKLLAEIGSRCPKNRQAYYVCTIALSDPDGTIHIEAEGKCWGRIIDKYRGSAGFGYDPLFEIPEYHQTFAELGNTVKSVLSHRARALERFVAQLRSKFARQPEPGLCDK